MRNQFFFCHARAKREFFPSLVSEPLRISEASKAAAKINCPRIQNYFNAMERLFTKYASRPPHKIIGQSSRAKYLHFVNISRIANKRYMEEKTQQYGSK